MGEISTEDPASRMTAVSISDVHRMMDELERHTRCTHPPTQEDMTFGQTIALGVFVAAFELYRGIGVLVRSRLGEEGRILYRSLLETIAYLSWFAADPSKTEQRALRFTHESLNRERLLVEKALALGLAWGREELKRIGEVRTQIESTARAGGFALSPPPDFHDIMAELHDSKMSVDYLLGNHATHTSRLSIGARFSQETDNRMMVAAQAPDHLLAEIGVKTIQSFSLGLIKTCEVLGWDSGPSVAIRTGLLARSTRVYFALKPTQSDPAAGP